MANGTEALRGHSAISLRLAMHGWRRQTQSVRDRGTHEQDTEPDCIVQIVDVPQQVQDDHGVQQRPTLESQRNGHIVVVRDKEYQVQRGIDKGIETAPQAMECTSRGQARQDHDLTQVIRYLVHQRTKVACPAGLARKAAIQVIHPHGNQPHEEAQTVIVRQNENEREAEQGSG